MKNDNIHIFSPFWLQILNLPASLRIKNTQIGPWKRSVLQNPDRERTNQSTGICLRLGLPYNNLAKLICFCLWHPYGTQASHGQKEKGTEAGNAE